MKKKRNLILHIPTYLFVLLLSFVFFVFPASVHAKEVTISPKVLILGKNETATVKLLNTKQKVTWKIRHKSRAKILTTKRNKTSSQCTLKATGGGNGQDTYIQASIGDTVYKCKIIYEHRVQNVTSIHITKGNQKQLLVSTEVPVKWTSNRKSVASVSKTGIVKGRKPGNAVITAQVGNQKFKYKVKVSSKISDSKKYRYKIKKGEAIITDYIGDEDIVKIPKKLGGKRVTQIAERAFGDDFDEINSLKPFTLKEVTIPKGVRSIGTWSFASCPYLSKVSFPSTMQVIGDFAFDGDKNLKTIRLPSSIRFIDECAFSSTGLTSIIIPNQVTIMKKSVFSNCKNLTSVKLPANLKIIEDFSFHNLPKLKAITIPNGTKEIQAYAFYDSVNLEKVVIPESVTKLDYAFHLELHPLTFPSNLTIYGKSGSKAEEYANKYHIKFVAMN